MSPAAPRASSMLLASIAVVSGGCAPEDAGVGSASAASTPPTMSVAIFGAAAASASSVASASAQASADACQSDSDCLLLTEDQCCVQTTCDQDRQAMTKARAQEKHQWCARMDCQAQKPKQCRVADVRVVAACRGGRCVLLEPGTGGTERIREPLPTK